MSSSAISLFAGAGGMDIGVHGAGFKTVCAIESDPHCAATLRRNGVRKVVWQADVRVVDPQRLLDVLGFKAGELGPLHGARHASRSARSASKPAWTTRAAR